MENYFTTASPLPKKEITNLFESIANVTKLLVAPFGLSEEVDHILGEDVANNDYKSIYRSWEDSISSRLYSIHQMSEDRIAASMQLYVEKKQDSDILRMMQRNESLPLEIIRPATVVELPSNTCVELAVAALQSVIGVLQAANDDLQNALSKYPNMLGLKSIYSSDVHFIATTFSVNTLEKLRVCLSALRFSSDNCEYVSSISYDQYIALLDTYQKEPAIQSILLKLLSDMEQTQLLSSKFPVLKYIRYVGASNLPLCSLFCHPIFSAIYHLESQLKSEVNPDSSVNEESYLLTMKFLDALERIQQHKNTSSCDIFGMQPQQSEEGGDTLQIMCVIDEVFGKENSNENESSIYNNHNIPARIRSALLVERASCRLLMQELDEALRDAKHAVALDPKNHLAHKIRYKVYRQMAAEAEDEDSEPDELDLNGASSDDERGPRPPLKRLLMKAAFEALAAFVLGGSSNLSLAGEAEDATREACRGEAKTFFWKRQNNDDDEDEEECTDEDEAEETVEIRDVQCVIDGDVSSLCRCHGCEKCDNEHCGLYANLIHSSCIPKRWMVSAFQALYAPIHSALDIPLPASRNQVLPHEDGLGEDGTPFDHIVPSKSDDNEDVYYDQPEGDDDAFNLICKVANALSRGVDGTDHSFDVNELESIFKQQTISDNSSIITLEDKRKESLGDDDESSSELRVHIVDDPAEFIVDLTAGHCISKVEEFLIESSGRFRDHINPSLEEKSSISKWNCLSVDFLEAFELVTAPSAHELTGVNFVWKETPQQNTNSHLPHQRFRISAGLIPAMQDAICDRSMHNSMHMVESYESEDSESCGNQADDADEESVSVVEKQIRKVSRQLRARLLSLCGSIAYLLGDSMGGYECMKASILLEGESLDSRIKIATMLMEMDELDKAEVHLNDARRKWPNEIVVDLHEAELAIHRTDYAGAVDILRKSFKYYEDNWTESELNQSQRETMEHIGPSVYSLRGVAEFRISPESPEIALSVLRKGVERYPRSTSLLVCLGEVLSQTGDPSGALKFYSKASKLEPGHPMPYLNASRIYQQLNQKQLAKLHMKKALQLDDALSLALVDIAQYKIQENKKNGILPLSSSSSSSDTIPQQSSQSSSMIPLSIDNVVDELSISEILDYALNQARHVSEILDIFTARQIATFYEDLHEKGLVSRMI